MRNSAFLSAVLLCVFTIDMLLVASSTLVTTSWAWSNGGYSSDPANPDYGTHDWIAEHALDWLPAGEKQYIVDNRAAYLYGTELPDNGGAPEGIGDTTLHHIYYDSAEVMTDDAAALRASTEYDDTLNFLRTGNLTGAAKNAGIMNHYIVDIAVFGHVMGAATEWGVETHHSDYETYVNDRTSTYAAEFNTYLSFDGTLSAISAYEAAKNLAYDTTFDVDGDLTCVWMDQNYDWSNSTFKNRAGESLNLAVNYLADVLHTLHLEANIPNEHYISVPYHAQTKGYYCGPAALEMIFDYYGPDIPQSEIADAARTASDGTYTTDMIRATHFSNLSTSVGNEMPGNINGYTARQLGYAAFEHGSTTIDKLKFLLAADYPIIVLTTWHFRVAVGYNSTHITFQDSYYGSMYNMTYAQFDDDWDYSGHWALLVTPWKIQLSTPTDPQVGSVFDVTATITYPTFPPFSTSQYPTSKSNATLTLPPELSLTPEEQAKKTIDTGNLTPGQSATVQWAVSANAPGNHIISVEAEGKVKGSVPALPNYPTPYSYVDRIGALNQTLVSVIRETTPPVTTDNYDDLWHTTDITITLTATDTISGVAETYYKINNAPTKTVSADGQPIITTESDNNTLEYWSKDKADNEENHHILTGIKLDKTAPTGSITINNNDAYATAHATTLTLTATDATSGINQVRYSNDGVWDTEPWENPSTAKTWVLTTQDGTKTVYCQIKDNAGLVSPTYSDAILLDTTPPIGSISINEGLASSRPTVTLTLSSEDDTSGVAQMRFSHDEITWTLWEAYSTTKTWTLTANDGAKNVHAQFKDHAGLISLTYSDTIKLDTAPPTISITNPTPDSEIKSSTITITWTSSDETSGINHYEIRLDNGQWKNIQTNTTHTLTSLTEGTHIIDVKAADNAENERQSTVTFLVNTSPLLGPGYIEEAAITIALIAAATLGIALYVIKKRRKS